MKLRTVFEPGNAILFKIENWETVFFTICLCKCNKNLKKILKKQFFNKRKNVLYFTLFLQFQ
jgi:hypothetical protein